MFVPSYCINKCPYSNCLLSVSRRVEGSLSQLFWALFGLTELSSFETNDAFQMTQNTGKLLFAVYNVSMIVVTMNMLIAMMSNTFQHIEVEIILQHLYGMQGNRASFIPRQQRQ